MRSPQDDPRSRDPDTVPVRVDHAGPPEPVEIRGYRIGREIGRGGMGTVFEATQSSPQRTVAIKVLRSSGDPELLARFTHEALVLGWLQHPAIAHVYESGLARDAFGERPFIAMERVNGLPIDRYVEEHGLATEARLRLVMNVIDGVHHAHQKGVIHRDLKPANILVEPNGQPKIVDFGVARAVGMDSDLTAAGELIGTLGYMSPEQVAADPTAIDTRSDVYALGVLTYRLLSGLMPLVLDGLPIAQASRRVAEDAPLPLRAVAPSIPADVETIVHKALDKVRERRYPSAAAMGEDIGRYLRREPIEARPPSAAYRLGRLIARHRGAAAGLVLATLALVVGASVASVLYLQERATRRALETSEGRLEEALEAAEMRADDLRETHVLFGELLRQSLPSEGGSEVRLIDVLDQMARGTEERFAARPAQRFWFDSTLAATFAGIESSAAALRHVDRARAALAEIRAAGGPEPLARELVDIDFSEAAALRIERRFTEALHALERARQRLADNGLESAPVSFSLDSLQGETLLALQRFGDAVALARGSIERAEAREWSSEIQQRATIADLRGLEGTALAQEGRLEEAHAALVAAREGREGTGDVSRAAHASALEASVLLKLGRFQESEEGLGRAIEQLTPLMGDDRAPLASLHATRAMAQQRLGDTAGAESSLGEALAIQRRASPEPHPYVAQYLSQRGQLRVANGDMESGEADLTEALDLLELLEGPDAAMRRAYTLSYFVPLFLGRGEFDAAEAHLEEALGIKAGLFGTEEHPSCQSELMGLSHVARARGDRYDAAIRGLRALTVVRATYAADHPQVVPFIELLRGDVAALEAENPAAAAELGERLTRIVRGDSSQGD